jgi:DNA repair photolyase
VRILTKNAAVVRDFDVCQQYRDRVRVGISLTATPEKEHLIKLIEPNASLIGERMEAMRTAHGLGLRTYAMLCPLLPGISDSPQDISALVDFARQIGAEEIFVEALNGRGNSVGETARVLQAAGHIDAANATQSILFRKGWSKYAADLTLTTQAAVQQVYGELSKLRVLLYGNCLTAEDRARIQQSAEGVRWLGRERSNGLVCTESITTHLTAATSRIDSPAPLRAGELLTSDTLPSLQDLAHLGKLRAAVV